MLVLTYHSISDAAGPTSIPAQVFDMQMQVLADLGRRSLRLSEFIDWHEGKNGADNGVLITFDDAFEDFAQVAAPILQRQGFSALDSSRHGGWATRKDGKAQTIRRAR